MRLPFLAEIQNAMLWERMTYFNLTEEGREKMCQFMEDLIKEENREHVQRMLGLGLSKETIMASLDLTEEDFKELASGAVS